MHGYQHTAVNTVCTVLGCGALALIGYPQTAAALAAGLAFGTLLVTPDLDLRLNDARRNWGPFRFIWAPYAALSKHRGMSHTYLLGPTIRLLYLALWVAPVLWLISRVQTFPFPNVSWRLIALVGIGYFIAQWLHLLCDGISPALPGQRRATSARRPRPRRS
ncbi:DUF2227 family putative metal-binding protein [Deinococcus sp. Leaf326]|uniref:DUF2227 family putative metal-binding protein n=1 Tax=Deinococcus sp. Leaf326 TaxID=1736338 RepID=UPI0009E7CB02|nr:DUF2227 family putative metal-binding protein [Deinococcus sp. Leaf326]